MFQNIKKHLEYWSKWLKNKFSKKNQFVLSIFTILLIAISIYDAIFDILPIPFDVIIYCFSAIGFVLTFTLWIKSILFFIKNILLPFTQTNAIANAVTSDQQLRAVLTTLPGLGMNLIYAIFNGIIGITARSAWYGSLSAYYILLCSMRFFSVSYAKQIYLPKWKNRNKKQREWKVYHHCGAMLAAMSVAMGGAVIMLVTGKGGKSYPGLTIYAIATYTFYKLIMSIIHMVNLRKNRSVLLMTLRNIGYADALVSVLSLQTALFSAFGKDSGNLVPIMNTLTGVTVCIMILSLGIRMMIRGKKNIGERKKK